MLADPRRRAVTERLGPAIVKAAVIDAQQRARDGSIPPSVVADNAVAALPEHAASLRPVGNATGVLRARRVIGRRDGGRLLLDLRAVDPADDPLIVAAVLALRGGDA
ncbi:MAG: selenocysteine synthase [Actinomycetia bacterium]|nr:selenocysteine synthase [Actinomycetes bacterium]